MRKVSLTLLAGAMLAAFVSAAQAQPANPLVRPMALANRSSGGMPGGNMAMPPMPPAPTAPTAGASGDGEKGAQSPAKTVQAQLARYAVVAISGDMAVLRAVPGVLTGGDQGAAGAPQAPGAAAMMLPMAGAAGASGNQQQVQQTANILPSVVLRHRQNVYIQDVEVIPEIANGQVSLRMAEGHRVVYYGRLDGMSTRVALKGVKVESNDSAYVQRQSPPVSASAANGSSGTGPGTAATGGANNSNGLVGR